MPSTICGIKAVIVDGESHLLEQIYNGNAGRLQEKDRRNA
jgi:hypothetical protein